MPANRNKKTEKAFHAEARNTWSRKPVTQVVGNRKAYNRKKDKMEFHRTLKQGNDGIPFFLSVCAAGPFLLQLRIG
jgi:hypothetical protein